MKCVNVILVLSFALFVAGCQRARQLKVTYMSDPPGGVLCKQNGEVWGPCPMALWYDLSDEVIKNGYIHVEGLSVHWPNGMESRSSDLLQIRVNGTDQQVIFTQPNTVRNSSNWERLYYRRY